MTERVMVEFECPKHHLYARVVATSDGIVVVFPAMDLVDVGKPGKLRHRREPVEHRQTLGDDRTWIDVVICSCRRPQRLTQPDVEVQLREWERFNSQRSKPRRIVWRKPL
jgi:hypothetical protein